MDVIEHAKLIRMLKSCMEL